MDYWDDLKEGAFLALGIAACIFTVIFTACVALALGFIVIHAALSAIGAA